MHKVNIAATLGEAEQHEAELHSLHSLHTEAVEKFSPPHLHAASYFALLFDRRQLCFLLFTATKTSRKRNRPEIESY